MRAVLAFLLCLGGVAPIWAAPPVSSSGAEVAWTAPLEGYILDAAAGIEKSVALSRPRRLSAQTWLAAQLRAGEVAWVHLDGDPQAQAVRFAFLSGGIEGMVAQEATPAQPAPGDFLFTAPPGPPTRLGIIVRAAHEKAAPRAQIWRGGIQSPGFRWELWEEQAKAWAKHQSGPPPAPPDLTGEPLVERLKLIADAINAAPAAEMTSAPEAVAALLRAEALLANLPGRELRFPYFRRYELTDKLARATPQAKPVQKIEDQRMFELTDKEPLRISIDGPAVLRIEARTRYEKNASPHPTPLRLQLRSQGRLLALAAEELLPQLPQELEASAQLISSRRRILITAAPGRHTYDLQLVGGPAWISVYSHTRSIHAEDLASHSEDISRLLSQVHVPKPGVLADLLTAEVNFLSLNDDAARTGFAAVAQAAHSPLVQAFALLRLSALHFDFAQAERTSASALALLKTETSAEAQRLRHVLVADQLIRVVAKTAPKQAAPAAAIQLLEATPEALPYMLPHVGPLLRYLPGQRARALPMYQQALRQSPLDAALRHYADREWYTGTRWTALPGSELGGAQSVSLLAPPLQPISCADAAAEGLRAFAPLGNQELTASVAKNLAPPPSLHRFDLISLRTGVPRLGWASLTLNGQTARLPLIWPRQTIALALGAGPHKLRAAILNDPSGSLLAPCKLLSDAAQNASLVEHHFSSLATAGSQVHAVIPEPGIAAFVGLEIRPSPTLRAGKLLVRTAQGLFARIEVSGHGVDYKVVGLSTGPAIVVVLPLPAATQYVDIVREDDGAPILLRTLLRRSLAAQNPVTPRVPTVDRDKQEELYARLRQATRAVRQAEEGSTAQAQARLLRAEILTDLQAVTLARLDVERVLLGTKNVDLLERARALSTALTELPLISAPRSTETALILTAGANLSDDTSDANTDKPCIDAALRQWATAPEAARQAAAGCDSILGNYAAALMEENGGSLDRAAQHYASAYQKTRATGRAVPALAREAALRFFARGAGPAGRYALALAAAAEQAGDSEGARALGLVRRLSHAQPVRGTDSGLSIRVAEPAVLSPSLRAALSDISWDSGLFLEVRPGKSTETDFHLSAPMGVRVETLCDDAGEPNPVAPPCQVRVAIDGAPIGDSAVRSLRPGQRDRSPEVHFGRGEHRIQVTLDRASPGALAFVHLLTSRPIASERPNAEGDFAMPIIPPPVQRFVALREQPVRLRVHGPTALRVDAWFSPSFESRALAIELEAPGRTAEKRVYPVCTQPAEQKSLAALPGYDCHSTLMVPLLDAGTYQLQLAPLGATRMATALAVFDDEPALADLRSPSPPNAKDVAADETLLDTANSALLQLRPPLSYAKAALGTLQIEQTGVFGSVGRTDLRVGDSFAQTAIYYRRRLADLPVWLRGASYLRLREGAPSYGGEGMLFGRIPVIELRTYAQLQAYTQSVNGHQEYSIGFHSYLERSIEIIPHLYILPRFGFTASYQSLKARPALPGSDGDAGPSTAVVTPIDLQVFNLYDAAHQTGLYGQMLLWWVPFINTITFARARLTSNQSVRQLDSVSGRLGLDMAFHTTEIVASYELEYFRIDDARQKSVLQHRIMTELSQTIWLNRNHRLGLRLSSSVEASSRAMTWIVGGFWEGSHGRGLDDYSTPEINLPQQLGRGRGFARPEETFR